MLQWRRRSRFRLVIISVVLGACSFWVAFPSLVLAETWIAIPPTGKARIEPGSILDFSGLMSEPEAISGKYGPIVARDGHFEWRDRPGKPSRFYGINLCFSANYIERKDADDFAETLWRSGYNAVRIHHYERDLLKTNAVDSLDFDPLMWDRLDYLVHALKKRGIGITTDLFVNRTPVRGEIAGIDWKVTSKDYKGLVFIHPPAMENLKAFARKFFEHENPYTHSAWKNESALLFLSYVNEDTESWKANPSVSNLYHEACLKKYPPKDGSGRLDAPTFIRFCMERQSAGFEEIRNFLSAMGVKAPATDLNFKRSLWQMPARNGFDYVDQHAYWDHPQEAPGGARRYALTSYMEKPSSYGIFSLFPMRIFGRPFTVTEFNHVYPNPYRAESILVGAYAGLQDWDALFRFNFSNDRGDLLAESPIVGFNIANDPVALLSDRVNLLMFLRRDVKSSEIRVPLTLPRANEFEPWQEWNAALPVSYLNLGLVGQIGVRFADAKTGASEFFKVVLPTGEISKKMVRADDDFSSNRFTSSTRELDLRFDSRQFRAVTPKSEALVLNGEVEGNGSRMSVKNGGGFAVFFAASMDGNDLDRSERILVLHMTDVQNSEVGWKDGEKNVLGNYGKLPRLVAVGKAEMRIKTGGSILSCFACDLSGKRLREVPLTKDGAAVTWKANTGGDGANPVLVYELNSK